MNVPQRIAYLSSTMILTLEELRALPAALDGCSGIYFLWLGSGLQYIGQSRDVGHRVVQHHWNFLYGGQRARAVPRIKFDSSTILQVDDRPYMEPDELRELRETLLALETAYIDAYATPFNNRVPAAVRARYVTK